MSYGKEEQHRHKWEVVDSNWRMTTGSGGARRDFVVVEICRGCTTFREEEYKEFDIDQ